VRGMELDAPTVSATAVSFDDNSMWVDLSDGRTIGVPYAWFPRLLNATPEQREAAEIGRFGLHWEDIDEDISIAGLLAGRRDQTVNSPTSGNQTGSKEGSARGRSLGVRRRRSHYPHAVRKLSTWMIRSAR
jgi:hypothetical protein